MGVLIFVLGLTVGSFLNVCIYRLPRGESVVRPPSRCPACGMRLRPRDLVPVVSYVLLRGRCSACSAAISWRYPAVELVTAVLFLWCYAATGAEPALAKALVFTAFLLVIAVIDYDRQLILDRVVVWLAGAGVVLNLLLRYQASAMVPGLGDMLAGALLGGSALLAVAALSHGGMGGGDVKCAAALGLWLGWRLMLVTLFCAVVLGGLVGIVLLALRRKSRRDMIPFGPFLAAGAFIAMLYGRQVWQWYMANFF